MYLAYFDTNTLSRLNKPEYSWILNALMNQYGFDAVFSKTTLRDLNGSPYSEKVIQFLDDQNFKLIFFEEGKNCQVINQNPQDVWKEVSLESADQSVLEFSKRLLAVSSGNTAGMSLKWMMQPLLAYSDSFLCEQGKEALFRGDFGESLDIFKLRKAISASVNQSETVPANTVNELQKLQLNNFQPPNVLDKVFDRMLSEVARTETNKNGDAFRSTIAYFKQQGEIGFDFVSISFLGFFLSQVGFHQDKNLRKSKEEAVLKGARSDLRDAQHVAFACYCEVFFTFDKAAAKRHYAICEWIGIQSATVFLDQSTGKLCQLREGIWPGK